MNTIKSVSAQPPTAEQHAMADFLLSICPSQSFLVKDDDKQRYITLDEQVGKSRRNKNAVSILKRCTSFMVPDWSSGSKAEQVGLTYKSIDNTKLGKRLEFPKLTVQTINEMPAALSFFKDLLIVAKQESQSRQTRSRSVDKN